MLVMPQGCRKRQATSNVSIPEVNMEGLWGSAFTDISCSLLSMREVLVVLGVLCHIEISVSKTIEFCELHFKSFATSV